MLQNISRVNFITYTLFICIWFTEIVITLPSLKTKGMNTNQSPRLYHFRSLFDWMAEYFEAKLQLVYTLLFYFLFVTAALERPPPRWTDRYNYASAFLPLRALIAFLKKMKKRRISLLKMLEWRLYFYIFLNIKYNLFYTFNRYLFTNHRSIDIYIVILQNKKWSL